MKRAVAIAMGMAALTAGVALRADQSKVDQKFCEAGAAFQLDVAELNTIGPHSTVAELRAVRKRLDKDVDKMRMAATFMKRPSAKQFLDATSQLDKDVDNVPDDATLQQAHSRIEADVQNAGTSGRQLAAEAGCSQP